MQNYRRGKATFSKNGAAAPFNDCATRKQKASLLYAPALENLLPATVCPVFSVLGTWGVAPKAVEGRCMYTFLLLPHCQGLSTLQHCLEVGWKGSEALSSRMNLLCSEEGNAATS
jgi:hypothetical protein